MGDEQAKFEHEVGFHPAVEGLEAGPALDPPDRRMQDIMLQYFKLGDASNFGHDFALGDDTHERYTRDLARRVVAPEEVSAILATLEGPANYEADPEHPAEVFKKMAGEWQQKGILAHFSNVELDKRDDLTDEDLGRFLKLHPEPVGFERAAAPFLDQIEKQNSPEKRAEYERSLLAFQRTVYGRRQEYWEQFQLMFGDKMKYSFAWSNKWYPQGEG